jgi:DNA-binding IclR family transcriptional regulator
MPLVAEGNATVAHLGQVTDLDEQPLRAALDHLVRLNLVNCQRDLYEPRYTIHNLTRTFLQKQIAQWS